MSNNGEDPRVIDGSLRLNPFATTIIMLAVALVAGIAIMLSVDKMGKFAGSKNRARRNP